MQLIKGGIWVKANVHEEKTSEIKKIKFHFLHFLRHFNIRLYHWTFTIQ